MVLDECPKLTKDRDKLKKQLIYQQIGQKDQN